MNATIIYLNGTSSSGKSTVAQALSSKLPEAIRLSADEYGESFEKIHTIPDPYESILSKLKNAEISSPERNSLFFQLYNALNDHPLPDAFNPDLNFYRHIRKSAVPNSCLIIDDLISTEFLYKEFLKTFQSLQASIYLIKIHCPIDFLELREKKRGDRIFGMARFWGEHPITNLEHDLTVDTSLNSPEICGQLILNFINRQPNPTAFSNNFKTFFH
jgi:chloramphenicol 3-O phosphotransferase